MSAGSKDPPNRLDTSIELGAEDLVEEIDVEEIDPEFDAGPTQETSGLSSSTAALPPEIGTTLGNYKILSLIGSGGMANVFLAEHVQLERRVALKKLHPQFAQHKDMVQRFFQEAKSVNRIHHDHIIQVTDFLETDAGEVCYVMELLDGESLEEALTRHGPMSIERTLDLATQAAKALIAVHRTGIVHRDLKPANIFLVRKSDDDEEREFVKLLDFGISKVIYDAHTAKDAADTQAGLILGTPKYMAPEQAEARPIDARTDVYAFGIILYEMLCGSNPFEGKSTIETLSNQLRKQPQPPSVVASKLVELPVELDAIILRCLAKSQDDRFQNMEEVLEALRTVASPAEAADTRPIPQPSFETAAAESKGGGGLRWAFVAIPLVVGLAAAVYFLGPEQWRQRGGSPPEAVVEVPVVQPSPEPEPTPPTAIEISFASRPAGAEVSLAESGTVLGTTPFTRTFEPADEPLEVKVKLVGYRSKTATVAVEEGSTLSVVLRPTRKPSTEPKAKIRKDVGRSGTVNPFE